MADGRQWDGMPGKSRDDRKQRKNYNNSRGGGDKGEMSVWMVRQQHSTQETNTQHKYRERDEVEKKERWRMFRHSTSLMREHTARHKQNCSGSHSIPDRLKYKPGDRMEDNSTLLKRQTHSTHQSATRIKSAEQSTALERQTTATRHARSTYPFRGRI